ncbi:uncharacterized protein LOC120351047 [Nilaparvata lugens]|uniref:uncharacterized protein LOC120351047 n=1 Tax=Nilaparvata lugens TaxID=108931 RepID=UPI00193D09B3|nr:uncharacterized protein LOC120351047 [Nilaparvata lugens]
MTVSFGDNVQNRKQIGYNKLIVGGRQNSMNFPVVLEKKLGGREFVAVCHLKSEYPMKIFPTFEIMNSDLKSLEAMNDYRDNSTYSKYFDNELSEVWNCAKETNDDLPFLRVVNRQCMKKHVPNKVGEIHYSGMDEIWIESMEDAYDVRTKSIRYLDKSDYGLIDFSKLF